MWCTGTRGLLFREECPALILLTQWCSFLNIVYVNRWIIWTIIQCIGEKWYTEILTASSSIFPLTNWKIHSKLASSWHCRSPKCFRTPWRWSSRNHINPCFLSRRRDIMERAMKQLTVCQNTKEKAYRQWEETVFPSHLWRWHKYSTSWLIQKIWVRLNRRFYHFPRSCFRGRST